MLKKSKEIITEQIITDRLLLIPISMKYCDEVFKEFTVEITVYMHPAPPKLISETEEYIMGSMEKLRQGKDLGMVALDKITKEFFGCVGLHRIDTPTPVMGVWFKKSAHGHGYGREAMTAIKRWADENLEYDYVLYPVADKNIASRKIPESLGGVIVGESDKVGMGGNPYHCLEYRIYPEKK